MSADTITTMSRRRRRARRLIALALGVCALAIPANAAGQPIDNAQNSPFAVGAKKSTSPLPSAISKKCPRVPPTASTGRRRARRRSNNGSRRARRNRALDGPPAPGRLAVRLDGLRATTRR